MQLRNPLVVGLLILVTVFGSVWYTPLRAEAAPADYDIPNGHFYTQANGEGGATTGRGYAILDAGLDDNGQVIKFWSEFKRLGGVPVLGYPASRRFKWDGFWCQATQRVILQWRPDIQQVWFVNVFDKAHDLGKDDILLAARQVPLHESPNDAGKPFSQVIAERQSWMNSNPAIRNYYFSVPNPLELFGLPTSHIVTTYPNFDIIRLQRIVIQYWKVNVPGVANTGDITVGLGGDIAKEIDILPGIPVTETPEWWYIVEYPDQDCLSYNPNNLSIVNIGANGWQLRSGNSIMALLDDQTDAQNALQVARRHTMQCFIGRGNTRPNRINYIVQYFKGWSGLSSNVTNGDCIAYNPDQLQVANLGATGYRLQTPTSAMVLLDSAADGQRALVMGRAHNRQCFVGRDNTRTDRQHYIFEYWERSQP